MLPCARSLLVIYVWLSLILAKDTDYDNPYANRVAFIFSGSPRSFIYPAVHESIRFNLINGFCPPESCIPDVFARVSMTDNTHEKTLTGGGIEGLKDSKGIKIEADTRELPLVQHALHRLQLRPGAVKGALDVRYIDVGSSAEQTEMESRFTSERHLVFRTMDPRRYSMYFGRWSAYMQAKDYEAEHNITYDWFVHTRFDMAFGSAVKPCHLWSREKLWVTDLWPGDVPDTFALLTPSFAEAYYSMDALLQPGAFCLGGPNFNMETVKEPHLRSLGFNDSLIAVTASAACVDSSLGWSERILLRKLQLQGISRADKTLGFASFFMVVLRKTLRDYCNYLHPGTFIGWLVWTQVSSGGIFNGCNFMVQDIGKNHVPIGCQQLQVESNEEYSGDCILSKEETDWNFMPFRIRTPNKRGGACLTKSGSQLRLTPCVDYLVYPFFPIPPTINMSYSMDQLFYFYPLRVKEQTIRFVDYKFEGDQGKGDYCITVGSAISSASGGHSRSVAMDKCITSILGTNKNKMISVSLPQRSRRIKRYQSNNNLFKAILKTREFVSFTYAGGLCLSHSNGTLAVRECSDRKKKSIDRTRSTAWSSAFVIERTLIDK